MKEAAEKMYEVAFKALQAQGVRFDLVAVLPEVGAFAWWNGHGTFQMANVSEAERDVARDGYISILAIWTYSEEIDKAFARRDLESLATINPGEHGGWNDHAAYQWATTLTTLGPVFLFEPGDSDERIDDLDTLDAAAEAAWENADG